MFVARFDRTMRNVRPVPDAGIDLKRKLQPVPLASPEEQAAQLIAAAREEARQIVRDAVKRAEAQIAVMMRDAQDTAMKITSDAIARLKQASVLSDYLDELDSKAHGAKKRRGFGYAQIEQRICRALHVSRTELRGKKRYRDLAFARQAVIYWCCRLTDMSLPEIGRRMGGLDHSSVHHSKHKYVEKRKAMGRNLRALP